ncbi:phosphate ABC transporter substrate-binding protein [Alginatibacterium sediminis]|uniref:Phosphate ABC transporter substrate-binding protein n=1 Tax=Alginatibacterium sediminis TaxID=2164068 RepID=A0A420EIA5_9ALTE|nr:phosphate ABC transporter substrate-binding protein [Alginatibacterium sediminis]RKF20410.1 phosphate ABC transporter substrate-binding protein [Alginatibacterium sediminis]
MKKLVLALSLVLSSSFAFAGPVVIGNPGGADALSAAEAKKLFLGKLKKLPNGASPEVIEYEDGNPLRAAFHDAVTGKSESQLQAYWAKLVFTGKANPPNTVGSAAAAISQVSSNPAAVAYVDEADVTGDVKVLFKP